MGGKIRFKARLCAKGYVQQRGLDYGETYSPVVRYDTVRALLAMSASRGVNLARFDVTTAFLYGELEETDVYLGQPHGFAYGTDRVCHLKKGLCGLKQSPRCWSRRFFAFMENQGLKNSTADTCLFYRNDGTNSLYVAIYVDDGLIAGSSRPEIESFLKQLRKEFKIKVGTLDDFLGMKITCGKDGSIGLSQSAYSRRILDRFGMADSDPVSTPATNEEDESNEDVSGTVPYRQAVGSLSFLMGATRPDLAFSVGRASRGLDKPTRRNWNEVKRIFRYLRGTVDDQITYKKGRDHLRVFSDADFAGDETTRRSTSGVVAEFAGGAISWSSELQPTTALSSTEAEIIAASEGAKEDFCRNCLREWRFRQPCM